MLYIFDMGGVVTNSAVLDDKLSKVLGISVEEFERICGKKTDGANKGQLESLGLFSLCSDGIIDTNEFWAEFSKRSGIAVKNRLVQVAFSSCKKRKNCCNCKGFAFGGKQSCVRNKHSFCALF